MESLGLTLEWDEPSVDNPLRPVRRTRTFELCTPLTSPKHFASDSSSGKFQFVDFELCPASSPAAAAAAAAAAGTGGSAGRPKPPPAPEQPPAGGGQADAAQPGGAKADGTQANGAQVATGASQPGAGQSGTQQPTTASPVEWLPVVNSDCKATCSAAGKAAVDSGGSGNQLRMYSDAMLISRWVGELGRGGWSSRLVWVLLAAQGSG